MQRVIDLLQRACTVSVGTMDVVDDMAYWDDEGRLVVYGDRDELEWSMAALDSMSRYDAEEDPGVVGGMVGNVELVPPGMEGFRFFVQASSAIWC